jgi:hypothetical protein
LVEKWLAETVEIGHSHEPSLLELSAKLVVADGYVLGDCQMWEQVQFLENDADSDALRIARAVNNYR